MPGPNPQAYSTFQIFFYALRPGLVRNQAPTRWHLINLVVQAIFDAIIVKFMGFRALGYFILSSFFAGSLHPCAAHFIAEHYLWDGLDQETYSYYGPLNVLAYNVGPSYRVISAKSLIINRSDTITNTTTSPRFPGRGCRLFEHLRRSSTIRYHLTHLGQW